MLCSRCVYYISKQCKIINLFANKNKIYCDGKWFLSINDKSNTPDKVPS